MPSSVIWFSFLGFGKMTIKDVPPCAKDLDMNAKKEDGHCLDITRGCAERPALNLGLEEM